MKVGDLALVTYDKGGYKVKDCIVVITAVWGASYRFLSPTLAQGNIGQPNCQWSLPEPYLKPYIPEVGDDVVVVKQMTHFASNMLPDTLKQIGTVIEKYPDGDVQLKLFNGDSWCYKPNSVVPASLFEEEVDTLISELAKVPLGDVAVLGALAYEKAPTPKTKYRCINL